MRAQGEVTLTHGRDIFHWLVVLVLLCTSIYIIWNIFYVRSGYNPAVAMFYQVRFIGHTSANNPSLHCRRRHHHHRHHHHHHHHHHQRCLHVTVDLARCMGEIVIGHHRRHWKLDWHKPRVIIIAVNIIILEWRESLENKENFIWHAILYDKVCSMSRLDIC